MRIQPCVIRPNAPGLTVPFVPVFDGVGRVPFPVRTLQLGTRLPAPVETFPRPTVAGGLRLLLRRRIGDLTADRYLTLGADQALTLDVSAFSDLGLFIQEGSLPGYNVSAILSEADPPSRVDTVASLVVAYAGAGTYPVPPGAISMAVTATDAAFRWIGRDTANAVDISVPLPAGWLSSEVWGDRFTCGGALGVLWRVGL